MRPALYAVLTSRTHALGLMYAKAYRHPCCALAKRLLRHEDELFQFVLIEGLSADSDHFLTCDGLHVSRGCAIIPAPEENRYGPLAQLVEQLTLNQRVVGSSPTRLTSITKP